MLRHRNVALFVDTHISVTSAAVHGERSNKIDNVERFNFPRH